MRPLRLSLAGTVILMLTVGLSGVVVAQDEEEPASDVPHQVSGTLTYASTFEPGSRAAEGGRILQRGYFTRAAIEMDDVRLSGNWWLLMNRDYLEGGGEVLTGTVALDNDGGSWVGTMRGYKAYEPTGRRHYWQVELAGTGAYEGHSALLYTRGVTEDENDVEGFVFPGGLPDYPDPVMEDPREVLVATRDIPAGYAVLVESVVVPAAEIPPDALTDMAEARDYLTAVDIHAGQLITLDLLEPR